MMRNKIKKVFSGFLLGSAVLFVIFFVDAAWMIGRGTPRVFTSAILNLCGIMPGYKAVMDVPVEMNGKTFLCSLYLKEGAYYLLVGPYPFCKRQSDFFFIGRSMVLGRGLGDETNDWVTFLNRLYIFFDLTPGDEDASAPYYPFQTIRERDPATGLVHFTCSAKSAAGEETFRFSIPKHLIDALPEYRGEKRKE